MKVKFGKHRGKLIELVMLKDPQSINWVLGSPWLSAKILELASNIKILIKVFDQMPLFLIFISFFVRILVINSVVVLCFYS